MSFVLEIAEQITRDIDAMVAELCPDAAGRAMYGGHVFKRKRGDHSSMVCGHFIYKQHVGLEFSQGYRLTDPDGVLEGKGKFRRHVKLTSVNDLKRKAVRDLLAQAFSLE